MIRCLPFTRRIHKDTLYNAVAGRGSERQAAVSSAIKTATNVIGHSIQSVWQHSRRWRVARPPARKLREERVSMCVCLCFCLWCCFCLSRLLVCVCLCFCLRVGLGGYGLAWFCYDDWLCATARQSYTLSVCVFRSDCLSVWVSVCLIVCLCVLSICHSV